MNFLLSFLAFFSITYSQTKSKKNDLWSFLMKKNYVSIQLMKFPSGHLYLTLEMNDTTAILLLDTGAGATILEEKREGKFGLNSKATTDKATGAGGSGITMRTAIVSKFRIDKYNLDNTEILLMNLDHVNNAFKEMGLEQVDGVIGADILTKGQAIIDYTNLILYLKK